MFSLIPSLSWVISLLSQLHNSLNLSMSAKTAVSNFFVTLPICSIAGKTLLTPLPADLLDCVTQRQTADCGRYCKKWRTDISIFIFNVILFGHLLGH